MTQVETFECTEVQAEAAQPEATAEALQLIAKLELTGQQNLLTTVSESGAQTRSPFRQMTADERYVYRMLCPRAFKLAEYNLSPIPLRVLQVVAHAKECGIFDGFEVWDRESAQVHDPVLLGIKKVGVYDWNREEYILARWGAELESFPTLRKQALAQHRAAVKTAIEECRERIAAFPKEISDERLMQKSPSWRPYFND